MGSFNVITQKPSKSARKRINIVSGPEIFGKPYSKLQSRSGHH